jgi:hypothetical protein
MKISFAMMFFISHKLIAQSTPLWVNSPSEFCSSQEFCTVGEAAGSLAAETAAVNGIARIFNTKVSGTTNIQSNMEKDKVEENFTQSESLSTEKILLGVEIKERYKDPSGQNFALAVLKKQKARALVEQELKKAEDEVLSLIESPKLSKVLKAKKVLMNMETSMQDFVTITGLSYNAKIKLSDLERLEKKLTKNQSLFIDTTMKFDEELKHAVITEVLNNGWRVSTKPMTDHYELKLDLKKKHLHLKVEGFIKVAFETSLQAEINNKKVGAVNYKSEQLARNEEQAQYQHNEEFKKYLSENFYQLNLD